MTKKLSICMIVKDEEKNLRRCLDSLKPLLENNSTELIVVDTGSTDNTVNIAKEYTQKIFFHEWNSHFSDMRNISISYATGEWIFIIDADEVLETPLELISLLKSIELKKYKTIKIQVKNIVSIKPERLVSMMSERVFLNDGTFCYRGTIHNQPIFQNPVLTTNIELTHYGYINDDKELMEKKFKRTATMLEKELEKDPQNIYYRFQLARSYNMHDDKIKALQEITKAYELVEKLPKELFKKMHYVLGEYAKMSFFAGDYKKVINICLEILAHIEIYPDLYYFMGHSYLFLKEYEKGIESLDKYLQLYRKYNRNELDLSHLVSENYMLDQFSFESTLDRLILELYKQPNISHDLRKYIPIIDEIKSIELKSKLLTKIYILYGNYEKIIDLYNDFEVKEKRAFVTYLERLKKDFNEQQTTNFENLFATLPDDYGLLNKIRIAKERNKLLIEFINNHDIIKFSDEIIIEFVKYLMESNYLNKFFKKIDSQTIKKIVKVLIDTKDKMDYFLNSLRNDFGFNDFQNNRIYIAIANVILLTEEENAKNENRELNPDLFDIFNKYIENGVSYVQLLYQIDRIRLTYTTLDVKEDKFFIRIFFTKDSIQRGDIKGALRYYKEAVEEYPYMAENMKEYLTNIYMRIADYYKVQGKYKEAIEMYEEALLKTKIKEKQLNIISLIENIDCN